MKFPHGVLCRVGCCLNQRPYTCSEILLLSKSCHGLTSRPAPPYFSAPPAVLSNLLLTTLACTASAVRVWYVSLKAMLQSFKTQKSKFFRSTVVGSGPNKLSGGSLICLSDSRQLRQREITHQVSQGVRCEKGKRASQKTDASQQIMSGYIHYLGVL